MTEYSSKLGIYLSGDAIFLVENTGNKSIKCVKLAIPMGGSDSDSVENAVNSSNVSAKIAEEIQKSGIKQTNVTLSLPPKDIIFRSFVLPWMQQNEISNAVRFEANKYIPFNLEELCYAVHPVTFTSNETKQLKIIFVAIKRTTLEYYKDVLQNANLTIEVIEPSTQSFLRILSAKKILPPTGISAIIDHNDKEGNIVIVENEIPQFVRTFQINPSGAQSPSADNFNFLTRLINETTISLEYYNRQNTDQDIDKVIYISNKGNETAQKMQEALTIDVENVSLSSIAPAASTNTIESINAYGSTLYDTVEVKTNFYIVEQDKLNTQKIQSFAKMEKVNIKNIMPVAIFCLAILGAIFFIGSSKTGKFKKEEDQIKAKLGSSANLETLTIDGESARISKRLEEFKSIRLSDNTASFLSTIPSQASEGMWFESIEVNYTPTPLDSKKVKSKSAKKRSKDSYDETPETPEITIVITGYVYVPEAKDQFNLVNQFTRSLKDNAKFSETFKSIELDKIQKMVINDYETTYFKVICQ